MLRHTFKIFSLMIFLLFSLPASALTIDNLFHHAADPVAGNPNGKVTVVEFFDYQCSHCRDMASAVNNIIRSNQDVRFVFKDFPIRGPLSEIAARAALASMQQGKYYEFSHALLVANEEMTMNNILQIAATVGLDIDKLKNAMQSTRVTNELVATDKLANELRVTGTPAFFVGKTDAASMGEIISLPGEVSQSNLQDVIDKMK